jgi:two-component system chemotaxis response regulator CheY
MLSALKFLIVDDLSFTREIVSTILKSADVRHIDYASDGAGALERIRRSMPDIVITDQLMTGMDGIDLIRLIRGSADSPNPFLPIIMLTGRTDEAFVAEARDAGMTEFASKPITAANLFSRINACIMRPRPFVRKDGYFGPDRRRRANPDYAGKKRRTADLIPHALD